MPASKKPAPIVVEPVRARAIRGPHPEDSRRWYWRAELHLADGSSRTLWTGWAHRDEITPKLIELIQEGKADRGRDATEEEAVETLRDLLETWVAAQLQRADLSDSWRRSARHSGRRLCAALGDVRLEAIGRTHLERYRDTTLRTPTNATGIASATVRQDFKMLRAAWSWGHELGLVADASLPKVPLKVVGVKDKRTPTREEIARVLSQLDEGWPRLAVLLLAATGARIGEIARLTWGDVDLQGAQIHIRRGKTAARTVPLGPSTVAELAAWAPRDRTPAPEEGLFGVSWKLIRSKLGTGPLERACEAAGVPKFTPHGLRRAAVDAFLDASVNPKVAGAILGQSDVVMLTYYAQASERKKRDALAAARLDVVLGVSGEGDPVPDAPNREEPQMPREEMPTVAASSPLPRTTRVPRNQKPLPS